MLRLPLLILPAESKWRRQAEAEFCTCIWAATWPYCRNELHGWLIPRFLTASSQVAFPASKRPSRALFRGFLVATLEAKVIEPHPSCHFYITFQKGLSSLTGNTSSSDINFSHYRSAFCDKLQY